MKNLNLFLLLTCHIVFTVSLFAQSTTSAKTFAFDQYQQGQAYKGIPFGSSIQTTHAKMNLGNLWSHTYSINNKDYLVFNNFRFDEGQSYFTKGGQLFQIVLNTSDNYPSCPVYHQIKKDLIKLFGKNDLEYVDSNTHKRMNITWEGVNMSISLHVSPNLEDKAMISIMIVHKKLNNVATKELSNSSNEIPKI